MGRRKQTGSGWGMGSNKRIWGLGMVKDEEGLGGVSATPPWGEEDEFDFCWQDVLELMLLRP